MPKGIARDTRRNPSWKGDEASYAAIHLWLRYHYDIGTVREDCERPKVQWANISGRYRRDVSDYRRLCVSCHHIFDQRKPFCKNGHRYTEATTYWKPDGRARGCRICRTAAARRHRVAAKA
jgi:hypothetical protein